MKRLIAVIVTLALVGLTGCRLLDNNPVSPKLFNESVSKPAPAPAAVRTQAFTPTGTDWMWSWSGPHFAVIFTIPHSTFSITRICAVETSGYDNSINNWTAGRRNLGNGWDEYRLLVPKRFRLKYFYLTDREFSGFFYLHCTYTY